MGDVVHRIDPVRQAGLAEPRMRRRDQAMPARQQADIGMFGRKSRGVVQEQDGRALALFEDLKFDAGDRDGCALQGTSSVFWRRG
jgi:hypothetical protein